MENKSRRSFLKNSVITMAGAGLYASIPKNLYASTPPSDRINMGVIGVNWWGTENMQHLLTGRFRGAVRCYVRCGSGSVEATGCRA
jgi:hypothetical protein